MNCSVTSLGHHYYSRWSRLA